MPLTPPSNLIASPVSSTLALPTITTSALPAATLGVAYSAVITATGGIQPYTWRINDGALPPGLTLLINDNKSAKITGVPSAVGAYNFTIMCVDAVQQQAKISMLMAS